ncbi:ABC transporter ATP-binding protein [Candidatus Woesearchaeota archaeon]|nr:ABC transporter ATP-binding protein [Candidatus Woesearchaeota archaeon]
MALVQLKEVTKEYEKVPILQGVNINIEEGDVYGIIGESGSGKTTLLNMITGFLQPTDGSVLYQMDVTGPARDLSVDLHKVKKQIGFTPQHNSFYPQLTVKENLFHFGKLYKVPANTLVTNVKNLLTFTRLFEHRNKLADHLSEGMRRRLDIACSLIHKPRILVLDEPTADLDTNLQREILSLLQQANKQGVTIVIASHHLDSVEEICNKVAIVNKGNVFCHGLIDDIKKPFLKENVTITLKPGGNKDQVLQLIRRLPVEKIVDKGATLVVYPKDIQQTVSGLLQLIKEQNLYLNDMDVRKPSLKEIFEMITKK